MMVPIRHLDFKQENISKAIYRVQKYYFIGFIHKTKIQKNSNLASKKYSPHARSLRVHLELLRVHILILPIRALIP